ncbi:hypothetical protein TVAG_109720 [Trichomonas vaginalis G3]|uniref:Uncharacterized protein n=1 Tax=Trichomonas vaginalis (strain ATCC PRA-98 / G3) TaxID=412133 RepID=A2EAG1_TRIV3|nr:hypothetical protein TVAG_109720 [Trichomonas vaginalis G3]|eukprot:XP_001322611.1 hypothetical protein [Trichomonas vaginalis G3]
MDNTMDLQTLLNEMREKNGKIIAHPYSYISALHNPTSHCEVNQTEKFFTDNNIEFAQLMTEGDGVENAKDLDFKYVVCLDDAGAYRHLITKIDS